MNLKTVIWIFGLASLVLNLFALVNLDLLNVLLLLPSLIFTVSILAGPYLLKPRLGNSVGILAFVPRVLGWFVSVTIYTLISLWLPERGIWHWVGLGLLAAVVALLLYSGLRYVTYRSRVRRRAAALKRLVAEATGDPAKGSEIASQLMAQAGADPSKAEAILTRNGIEPSEQGPIVNYLQERVASLLRKPVADVRSGRLANNRWLSEFNRSLVFSLLVLHWLFVVPVPGMFVFTAGSYRVSFGLWRTFEFILTVIGIGLAGSWIARLIQWFDASGLGRRSLRERVRRAFAELQKRIKSSNGLSRDELVSAFALFTDIQTYMDQRSYGYARKLLTNVERKLAAAREAQNQTP